MTTFLPHASLRELEEGGYLYEVKRPMAWSEKDEANPDEKAVVRQLDHNIMPVLTILFFLSVLNRINLGNANVAGMGESLHLHGNQLGVAVAIFYVSYVVTELFANIALRFAKLNALMGGTMFVWGTLSLVTGLAVNSYKDLLIMRFALGIAQGFMIPASLFYITLWYPQSYWSMRMAAYWTAPAFAGAFGSLIARACAAIHDHVRPSWTYIFIIEGSITMVFGITAFVLLPESVRKARFLTPKQRDSWALRLEADRGYRFEHRPNYHVIAAFKDWKVYMFGLSAFSLVSSMTAVGIFLPTVILNLGYDANTVQCMVVPVYACSCLSILFFGWLAHRLRMYGIPLMICLIIGIAATACLQTFKSPRAQYGLTFLLGVGMFPAAPLLIAWIAANLQPITKRGVGIGIVIAMASCGGVLGSFIFAPQDAKTSYQTGHFALMICILGSFLISKFFVVYFRMHAFSQPPIEESLTRYLALTPVERFEEDLKGDHAMNFRYQM